MPKKVPALVLFPFRIERSGHISVSAQLSQKEARFIVDTGAGGTCIDTGALEAFQLALSKRSRQGGGVGDSSMRLHVVTRHDLCVAGLDLSGFKLHAIDLSHVNAGLKAARVKPVAGVLGADVLAKLNAVIDYSRKCIVLDDLQDT